MLGDLNEQEVVEILQNNIIGRIGCTDGSAVYVVPVSYVIVDGSALCHSHMGLKIEMMRKNPSVCFEVDEVRSYDDWRCVIAWGTYTELTDEEDIKQAKSYFSEYMLNMKTSKNPSSPETQADRQHEGTASFDVPIFYKIAFTKITGRFEKQS